MNAKKYILITPARNEEAYIQKALESVVAQTVTPLKWVIVNDNSTDRTAEIVRDYAAKHPFISLVESDPATARSFAAKVRAFSLGYNSVKDLPFDFIGNLDADLSFGSDYYERIIGEFDRNPALGVAGGVYLDRVGGEFRRTMSNPIDVPGSTQLFRRECFEQIGGGYFPLGTGGEDAAANITARMKGWQTRSFEHIQAHHHRRAGTGDGANIFRTRMNDGRCDYFLGTHPLFALVKSFRRIGEPPYVVGAAARAWGYMAPWIRGEQRQVPDEFVAFLRREQMGRLRGTLGLGGRDAARPLEVRR